MRAPLLVLAPLALLLVGTALQRASAVAWSPGGGTTIQLGSIETFDSTERMALISAAAQLWKEPRQPVHVVWQEVHGENRSIRRLRYLPMSGTLVSEIHGSKVVLNGVPREALLLAAERTETASWAGIAATARRLRMNGGTVPAAAAGGTGRTPRPVISEPEPEL